MDRLITNSFIRVNELPETQNTLLNEYLIPANSPEEQILRGFIEVIRETEARFDFEQLIEMFEFVVSPSEKIVNGAIYTPHYIRSYIVELCVRPAQVNKHSYKLADIACGCGGFLLTAALKIRTITGWSFYDIYRDHIYGVDIMPFSITRSKLLLTLCAIFYGEDRPVFDFNLFNGDSLIFDWRHQLGFPDFVGFHCIVGNPPYVASRNMNETSLENLKNWRVASTGHPDLYIPFFQIGLENLTNDGILGLITVNTFIKSINGRALRQYFADNLISLDIINFGGEQVFKDRNTYTCICFLQRHNPGVRYLRCESRNIEQLDVQDFVHFPYESLNHSDGWNLVNSQDINQLIMTIEAVGLPFKDLYETKNGIATLKNFVYKFTPVYEDELYYHLTTELGTFEIEKSICRDIVNANKLKTEHDLIQRIEKIIFPYTIKENKVSIIDEQEMEFKYPGTYHYLKQYKSLLAGRDKGKKDYETWYAYGRRQSMDIRGYKLFFPHICERPRFVISQNTDLLFYNGIAVVSESLQKLTLLKRLLESDLFYFYIKNTTKDYASGYISLSRNYLKNFGIYQFNEAETKEFLATERPEEYLLEKYLIEKLI